MRDRGEQKQGVMTRMILTLGLTKCMGKGSQLFEPVIKYTRRMKSLGQTLEVDNNLYHDIQIVDRRFRMDGFNVLANLSQKLKRAIRSTFGASGQELIAKNGSIAVENDESYRIRFLRIG